MDFNLTEERALLRDMLQRFLSENYSHEERRKLLASGKAYDTSIFKELADLGIFGALFREAEGGLGGAGFDIAVVFEELGRAGVIEPILGNAVLAGGLISELGTGEQKTLIGDVIAGQKILAFAHTEPASRYDLNHVTATAKAGGGQITLSGTKAHVPNGAQADMIVVSAREAGTDWDEKGISLFLVPTDAKGVTIVDHPNVDGTSAATIRFENVVVDEGARLGASGVAFAAIETAVARATLAVCAEAVGAMEAAKALTIEYLKERKQFGIAIGKFQALQHRMADLLIEVEQARSAVINLAGHLEAPRALRERHVSATKNLIGRAGALVAEETVQLHGGIGMTDEYALSHFARRIVMIDHLFGDVDHHLERFISLNAA
ncbi:acyl-CoA dehydrogenase family protein [Labrenzia sp. PHM005]|uniref:acyl-CoA dehydrogenase family protein n=1 Tax=Labrenzia sp. PHM005 TaxID=2590016 RepID=UPI0011408A05|nr:acyl-CoA dehydrogenase family protein [Labrenzia sp. PHM005]QDG78296.1 pimeloyl-CoA dehydrogenase small subunit [Labrenzia sp. PHM005]